MMFKGQAKSEGDYTKDEFELVLTKTELESILSHRQQQLDLVFTPELAQLALDTKFSYLRDDQILEIMKGIIGLDRPLNSKPFDNDIGRSSAIEVDNEVIWVNLNPPKNCGPYIYDLWQSRLKQCKDDPRDENAHGKAIKRWKPNEEKYENKIYGLYQHIAGSAIQMIDFKYAYGESYYNYSPHFSGNTCLTTYVRQKNEFSYKCEFAVYALIDAQRDKFYQIEADGTLTETAPHELSFTKEKEIFHSKIVGSIDLNSNQPVGKITIEVNRPCSLPFTYRGSLQSIGVNKISTFSIKQNLSHHNTQQPHVKSSIKKLDLMKSSAISEKLIESDVKQKIEKELSVQQYEIIPVLSAVLSYESEEQSDKMEYYIWNNNKNSPSISQKINNSDNLSIKKIEIIMKFFNIAIRRAFLQKKLIEIEENSKLEAISQNSGEEFVNFNIMKDNYIKDILSKNEGLVSLETEIQNAFKEFFERIKLEQFIPLMRFSNMLNEIKEATQYIKMNPEKVTTEHEKEIVHYASNLYEAIEATQFAINQEAQARMVMYFTADPNIPTNKRDKILGFLVNYFEAMIEGSLKNDLFTQQLYFFKKSILDVNLTKRDRSYTDTVANDSKKNFNQERRGTVGEETKVLPVSPFLPRQKFPINYTNRPYEISINTGDRQPEVKNTFDSTQNENKRLSIIALRMPTLIKIRNPEKKAALIARNPFIRAVNDGCVLVGVFSQLIKLYPNVEKEVQPYTILLNVLGGSIGALTGVWAVRNPTIQPGGFIRLWEASTDGLIVFLFSLGSAIETFIKINGDSPISDALFWGELAPIPIACSVFYTTWNFISLETKERWFRHDNLKRYYSRIGLDGFSKFLFYGGVLQGFLFNLCGISAKPAFQLIPLTAGILVSTVDILWKERKETVDMLRIYFTAVNFLGITLKDSIKSDRGFDYLDGIQIAYWASLFIFSCYFIYKHSNDFINRYEGPAELIVSKPEGGIKSDHEILISNKEYDILYEDQENNPNNDHEKKEIIYNLGLLHFKKFQDNRRKEEYQQLIPFGKRHTVNYRTNDMEQQNANSEEEQNNKYCSIM